MKMAPPLPCCTFASCLAPQPPECCWGLPDSRRRELFPLVQPAWGLVQGRKIGGRKMGAQKSTSLPEIFLPAIFLPARRDGRRAGAVGFASWLIGRFNCRADSPGATCSRLECVNQLSRSAGGRITATDYCTRLYCQRFARMNQAKVNQNVNQNMNQTRESNRRLKMTAQNHSAAAPVAAPGLSPKSAWGLVQGRNIEGRKMGAQNPLPGIFLPAIFLPARDGRRAGAVGFASWMADSTGAPCSALVCVNQVLRSAGR